ncbi:putative wd repeat-containing protein jip5 [Phaeomoniella chlamydospora]|uniref:WD repeat-containing protein JIP5 n=1 Tax=Phaeomoniella chlamydospora TaxID=158046 RepID=A0A0G2E943_PHACM|nr:putative wd repeat-containing protein jip5 [Phaeomoniella chlamydospora]
MALDPPTSLNILNPQNLVISTDSSAVYFYDLRADPSPTISFKPTSTHHPHSSFLSSLTPLPPSEASTSSVARQFVSTGGTTLAVTDIRRGVLVRSEDQEEELTASIYVSGLHKGGTSKGEKAVVGDASGVLTLWERGVWDDQDERIIVDRSGESLGIESLAQVPDHATSRTGPQGEHKLVATGLGDGKIKFVRLGANKVLSDWDLQHDEIEGVTALSFDVGGRLISGGGSTVKIWREAMTKIVATPGFLNGSKRSAEADSDDDDDDADAVNDSDAADDNSDEEKEGKTNGRKRRKRKRGRGKDRSGGVHVTGSFGGLN